MRTPEQLLKAMDLKKALEVESIEVERETPNVKEALVTIYWRNDKSLSVECPNKPAAILNCIKHIVNLHVDNFVREATRG